jgi:UDP-N-acetylglucosamine 2-epimerase (non-hydrolysing)
MNPRVVDPARRILEGHPRIHLTAPLGYVDFLALLSRAWLIVSDSGGVQEEAPSLGKPLIVLRENTERPEVVDAGIARLTGGNPETLRLLLEDAYSDDTWVRTVRAIENPFGTPDSGRRIAVCVGSLLAPAVSPGAQRDEPAPSSLRPDHSL